MADINATPQTPNQNNSVKPVNGAVTVMPEPVERISSVPKNSNGGASLPAPFMALSDEIVKPVTNQVSQVNGAPKPEAIKSLEGMIKHPTYDYPMVEASTAVWDRVNAMGQSREMLTIAYDVYNMADGNAKNTEIADRDLMHKRGQAISEYFEDKALFIKDGTKFYVVVNQSDLDGKTPQQIKQDLASMMGKKEFWNVDPARAKQYGISNVADMTGTDPKKMSNMAVASETVKGVNFKLMAARMTECIKTVENKAPGTYSVGVGEKGADFTLDRSALEASFLSQSHKPNPQVAKWVQQNTQGFQRILKGLESKGISDAMKMVQAESAKFAEGIADPAVRDSAQKAFSKMLTAHVMEKNLHPKFGTAENLVLSKQGVIKELNGLAEKVLQSELGAETSREQRARLTDDIAKLKEGKPFESMSTESRVVVDKYIKILGGDIGKVGGTNFTAGEAFVDRNLYQKALIMTQDKIRALPCREGSNVKFVAISSITGGDETFGGYLKAEHNKQGEVVRYLPMDSVDADTIAETFKKSLNVLNGDPRVLSQAISDADVAAYQKENGLKDLAPKAARNRMVAAMMIDSVVDINLADTVDPNTLTDPIDKRVGLFEKIIEPMLAQEQTQFLGEVAELKGFVDADGQPDIARARKAVETSFLEKTAIEQKALTASGEPDVARVKKELVSRLEKRLVETYQSKNGIADTASAREQFKAELVSDYVKKNPQAASLPIDQQYTDAVFSKKYLVTPSRMPVVYTKAKYSLGGIALDPKLKEYKEFLIEKGRIAKDFGKVDVALLQSNDQFKALGLSDADGAKVVGVLSEMGIVGKEGFLQRGLGEGDYSGMRERLANAGLDAKTANAVPGKLHLYLESDAMQKFVPSNSSVEDIKKLTDKGFLKVKFGVEINSCLSLAPSDMSFEGKIDYLDNMVQILKKELPHDLAPNMKSVMDLSMDKIEGIIKNVENKGLDIRHFVEAYKEKLVPMAAELAKSNDLGSLEKLERVNQTIEHIDEVLSEDGQRRRFSERRSRESFTTRVDEQIQKQSAVQADDSRLTKAKLAIQEHLNALPESQKAAIKAAYVSAVEKGGPAVKNLASAVKTDQAHGTLASMLVGVAAIEGTKAMLNLVFGEGQHMDPKVEMGVMMLVGHGANVGFQKLLASKGGAQAASTLVQTTKVAQVVGLTNKAGGFVLGAAKTIPAMVPGILASKATVALFEAAGASQETAAKYGTYAFFAPDAARVTYLYGAKAGLGHTAVSETGKKVLGNFAATRVGSTAISVMKGMNLPMIVGIGADLTFGAVANRGELNSQLNQQMAGYLDKVREIGFGKSVAQTFAHGVSTLVFGPASFLAGNQAITSAKANTLNDQVPELKSALAAPYLQSAVDFKREVLTEIANIRSQNSSDLGKQQEAIGTYLKQPDVKEKMDFIKMVADYPFSQEKITHFGTPMAILDNGDQVEMTPQNLEHLEDSKRHIVDIGIEETKLPRPLSTSKETAELKLLTGIDPNDPKTFRNADLTKITKRIHVESQYQSWLAESMTKVQNGEQVSYPQNLFDGKTPKFPAACQNTFNRLKGEQSMFEEQFSKALTGLAADKNMPTEQKDAAYVSLYQNYMGLLQTYNLPDRLSQLVTAQDQKTN